MARTTNYILNAEDLSFAREFVLKQVRKEGGFAEEEGLSNAFDDMSELVNQLRSRRRPEQSSSEFGDCLRVFNEHPRHQGIVGKLRNAIRVRRYRKTHGSRRSTDKTITISHESWALLKTVVKHGQARTLSEAILALDVPEEVQHKMRAEFSRLRLQS